jgi:hypothetical protein
VATVPPDESYLVDEPPDEHVVPMPDQMARAADASPRRRTLSFAGLTSAEPDLAERSEEILREEFGRQGR